MLDVASIEFRFILRELSIKQFSFLFEEGSFVKKYIYILKIQIWKSPFTEISVETHLLARSSPSLLFLPLSQHHHNKSPHFRSSVTAVLDPRLHRASVLRAKIRIDKQRWPVGVRPRGRRGRRPRPPLPPPRGRQSIGLRARSRAEFSSRCHSASRALATPPFGAFPLRS